MTREKQDIHFMAGLLRRKFYQRADEGKLDGDMETFIERATEDMYKKTRTGTKII
jgi:hypothetical protein